MNAATPESYFSVSGALITTGDKLPYDLFINSSALEGRERFVRIFPRGEMIAEVDLEGFLKKYRQLYIAESQRALYMRSICQSAGRPAEEKAAVLKDTAIHYMETLFNGKTEFSAAVLNQTLEGCRDVVDNMVDVLNDYSIDTLQNLIGKLSFHDFYTYDHSINVSMYSILLFKVLKPGAKREEVVQAGLGGLLHDIGKIQVPTHIINKPGKLTPEEWGEILKHPDYGNSTLNREGVQLPKEIDPITICRVVHEHHESFDGTGYPRKVVGENIHMLARVTAIADFFDAITTKRSYNDPLSVGDALALMGKSKGKKLDPKLFDLFAKMTLEQVDYRANLHELPKDFDPCQPRVGGFFKKVQVLEEKKNTGFGKIRFVGDAKDIGEYANQKNITVVAPTTAPRKKTTKAG